jgi:hypothetical protein
MNYKKRKEEPEFKIKSIEYPYLTTVGKSPAFEYIKQIENHFVYEVYTKPDKNLILKIATPVLALALE